MNSRAFLMLVSVIAWMMEWSSVHGADGLSTNSNKPPGVVIDHSFAETKHYIGSPSIAVLPSGEFIASHDFFGRVSGPSRTALFASSDHGKTWQPRGELSGQFWSSLFVHHKALYIMGTSAGGGNIVIRRSDDGGHTWTTPRDEHSGLLRNDAKFHCAPVPVVVHSGRIWRAMEDMMGGGGWPKQFRAFMMSATEEADLLQATNWISSQTLARNPDWLPGQFNGWLEGNAVVTASGELVDILRVDCSRPPEKAAIVRISPDGRLASFDPAKDFIDMPGGCKKFTIRYDQRSQLYWTLANPVLRQHSSKPLGMVRNLLALESSPDLRHWTVRSVVLYHPDTEQHAFQYVDWLFDKNDLILVSRTAFDDEEGGAVRQHDANYLTYHEIKNFRTLTMEDSTAAFHAAGISADFSPHD